MPLAFAIELQSRSVGFVVRDGKRYRLQSELDDLSRLNGRVFRSPQEAEKAIRRQLRAQISEAVA
jgi:hypothetical protein